MRAIHDDLGRCTDLASCIASCNDGEGDPGVCTQAADGLAAGRGGTVPDHAPALRLYRAACGLSVEVTAPATGPTSKLPRRAAPGTLPPPPPPSRGGPGGDYGDCKAASILKRHKWRGSLHLTVGFGDLYSDPAADTAIEYRNVPLISEQIGVGYASPSFSKDRLSFKVATAASGLLYRAVLDSEESKAVMVHPILFALDIGELVELYVSPAMLLIYPPEGGRNGTVRWGASVGLSVPLTAYLERL